LTPGLNTSFQPREDQFQSVPLLHFVDQFINGEISSARCQQSLDCCLVAVYIKKSTDNLGGAAGIDTLNTHLDEFGESILIKIENEVMDEIESIANDD
jgi:hypothetical protein